ncbi:MAG: ABC transporter ATP-binding protein [Methylacidiphilales bacterium]|nr:ABC transporter ATP-binding protein [Candidatus Methylacidiphilales bacterium]
MNGLNAPHDKDGKNPSKFWSLLAPYLRPYRKWIVLSIALNAFHGIAISFQFLFPKYLIDDVLPAGQVPNGHPYHKLALLLAAYLVASILCRMLAWHIGYRIFTWVRENVILKIRANFFRHINGLCLRFHGKYNSGELFSYLFGSPLSQVQQYLQQMAMNGPGAVLTLVSSIIWVFFWDWMMTLVLLASVVAGVWLMWRTRKRMQKLHRDFQFVESNVSGHVADLIRGSREIKLYSMEAQVMEDFQLQAGVISRKSVERDVKSHMYYMETETATYLFFALLCSVGAWRYLNAGLTLGELQAYLGAFIALQGPMQQLLQISSLRGGAQASLERLNAVLNTVSTTPDPDGHDRQAPERGDIVLRDVHFSYDQIPTLNALNLRIPYGQRLALVGASGSGKSTFAQLLLRFYDPNSGSIEIGGVDIRHCTGAHLRRRFGVVPQDPYFFQTNLRDNLRVVRPDADDERIRRACEQASAWEFISAMPRGLDTPVGEGGTTLSGGQRQRLAIARVLLLDPPYFIFDEATSALDTVSEKLIQESLHRAMAGRTVIFIAHRLATVKNCDRIIVLNKGIIAQDGTYAELSTQPGHFRNMVESDSLRS